MTLQRYIFFLIVATETTKISDAPVSVSLFFCGGWDFILIFAVLNTNQYIMKNIHKTLACKVLLSAAALLFGMNDAMSQTRTDEIVGQTSVFSIVRAPDKVTTIEYHFDGFAGSFNYVDAIYSVVKKLRIPIFLRVYDFEVHNDVVYFCGEDINLRQGMIGWFRIIDLINTTGTFHWSTLTTNNSDYELCRLQKMDVHYSQQYLHIAATAQYYNNYYTPYYSYGIAAFVIDLTSISFYGQPQHYNERGGVEGYDDIVSTSSGMVAVIHKIASNGLYARKYTPGIMGINILSANSDYIYYSYWGNGTYIPEDMPTLVTHIGHDSVATAYFVDNAGQKGIGICVYDGSTVPPTVIDNSFIPVSYQMQSSWALSDFTYHKQGAYFILLFNTSMTSTSTLYTIPYNGTFASYFTYQNINNICYTSIDHIIPTQATTVAGYSTTTFISSLSQHKTNSYVPCFIENKYPLNTYPVFPGHAPTNFSTSPLYPTQNSIPIQTQQYGLRNICH